ncbi:MAG TPA: M4 family metallopeptidase, partial [Dermatophilaceae bacterium]|nr:M4 family metallopeptidase [Dermatophilaceae bacterium]
MAQRLAVEQVRADSTKQALGLGTGEGLVVRDVITDPDGTTHVRYDRTYDGLRVIGGDFVSHRARSGKIKGVNWNGSAEVVVTSTKPKVSLSSAQASGSRKASLAQKTTAATTGELVVYSAGASTKAKPELAYDVLTVGVRADQTPSRVHTIVDASTGATLSTWDEIEKGAGNGIYSGPVTIGTTAGSAWTMRDAAGNYATDLNGATSTAAGTTFTDADDSWGNGAVTDRASAGVDAQYGAEKTFDYYKDIQGRDGIWGNGVGARSRVHYGDNYANAYWDGTQMTYGDGAGNTHPLVELDVAGHEMTHGVTENTAGLVGVGEAGGLNEATSDIFGTSVEWYAANAADNPDYLIGELVDINGDGSPLRYLDRPSRDGVSPDCWSPTLGALDVHYSAGPLNHWFYLAAEGSGAKTVNGVSYNSPTCNASTVTPIGRDVAARIWYRTLTTYLTSSNSYDAAREGAIQSAKDLYGPGSAQCLGVAAAFSAIAVPAGAQTCAVASPPPPGSNLLSNPGFESGDTLWSSTADVIAQWGGVGQPARTGTWSAWLGGYGATHEDSISQLVTIPAGSSATLSYYAHVDTLETGTTVYDTMRVRVRSTVLQT